MKHIIDQIPTFKELYDGLESHVELGNIRRVTQGDLTSYKYSELCVGSKSWDIFTLVARGIILDTKNECVVALPISKFFNLSEFSEHSKPVGNPVRYFEKMDGSCIIIYHYNNKWNTATLGSFNSDQAQYAQHFLDRNINVSGLNIDNTYICEIIYPENRIVVDYGDRTSLVFLAVNNRVTNESYEFGIYSYHMQSLGFDLPKTFKFNSMDEAVAKSKTIPFNEEGWVITFANNERLKIKGDDYVRMHALITNHTPLALWNVLVADGMDYLLESRQNTPEELWDTFDEWVGIYQRNLQLLFDHVSLLHDKLRGKTMKEIGLYIKENGHPWDQLIFNYIKYGDAMLTNSKIRRSVCNLFKPVANKLVTLNNN